MQIFRETTGVTFKQGMATALQVPERSISILNIEPFELRRGEAGAGAGADGDEGRKAYSGRHDVAQERGRGMRIAFKVAPLHQDNATLIAARLTRHDFSCVGSISHTQHEDTAACVGCSMTDQAHTYHP